MKWKSILLTSILAFLTGCISRPAPHPPRPEKPGLTYSLQYPVLLVFERRIEVRDDEQSLLRTTMAAGLNFLEARIVEPTGHLSTVARVTPFGQKSWMLDMGTSPFEMFLDLRRGNPLTLEKAKALVLQASPQGADKVQACRSIPELIGVCRANW